MFNEDPLSLAYKIEAKINEIEIEREKLETLAIDKAQGQSDYDRAMTLVYLKINHGTQPDFEGEHIGKIVQSSIPFIAKGICWKECLEKESTEGLYKACISKLEALKSELNGLQSINKHLDTLE